MWKFVKVAGAQDKDDITIIKPVGGLEKVRSECSCARRPDGRRSRRRAYNSINCQNSPRVSLLTPTPWSSHTQSRSTVTSTCITSASTSLSRSTTRARASCRPLFQALKARKARRSNNLRTRLRSWRTSLGTQSRSETFWSHSRGFQKHSTSLSYAHFSAEPRVFIQNWLAAQARDLDTMLGYQVGLGGNGGSVTEEDLRRSDLFNMPWVDEAITVHEAARMESERRR